MPMTRPAAAKRSTGACPFCGSGTAKRFVKSGYQIVRCRACKLEFVDPIPSDDELRTMYDDEEWFAWTSVSRSEADVAELRSSELLPESQRRSYDELLDAAEAALARRGSVLDIGCGNGPLLLRARDRGWDPHGLETSEWAVGFDREVLDLDVRRGVLEDHPFTGEQFDLVTMIHSLEHMPRPQAALEAVHGLLAPGGVLRVEVPNLDSLGRRVNGRAWRAYVPPSHLWYFTRASLVSLLQDAGFTAFAVDNRGFSPGIWRHSVSTGGRDEVTAATEVHDEAAPAGSLQARVKTLVRGAVRVPLQSLGLLDSLGVWARPSADR